MPIFETCAGCYFLTHTDEDGLCCAELCKTADSMRCIVYETEQDRLLKSDKVLEGVLMDLENFQGRVAK